MRREEGRRGDGSDAPEHHVRASLDHAGERVVLDVRPPVVGPPVARGFAFSRAVVLVVSGLDHPAHRSEPERSAHVLELRRQPELCRLRVVERPQPPAVAVVVPAERARERRGDLGEATRAGVRSGRSSSSSSSSSEAAAAAVFFFFTYPVPRRLHGGQRSLRPARVPHVFPHARRAVKDGNVDPARVRERLGLLPLAHAPPCAHGGGGPGPLGGGRVGTGSLGGSFLGRRLEAHLVVTFLLLLGQQPRHAVLLLLLALLAVRDQGQPRRVPRVGRHVRGRRRQELPLRSIDVADVLELGPPSKGHVDLRLQLHHRLQVLAVLHVLPQVLRVVRHRLLDVLPLLLLVDLLVLRHAFVVVVNARQGHLLPHRQVDLARALPGLHHHERAPLRVILETVREAVHGLLAGHAGPVREALRRRMHRCCSRWGDAGEPGAFSQRRIATLVRGPSRRAGYWCRCNGQKISRPAPERAISEIGEVTENL